MPIIKKKKENNLPYVVKTLSIANAADEHFEKVFEKLATYAQKHKLKRPIKGELMAKMILSCDFKPEQYFS